MKFSINKYTLICLNLLIDGEFNSSHCIKIFQFIYRILITKSNLIDVFISKLNYKIVKISMGLFVTIKFINNTHVLFVKT